MTPDNQDASYMSSQTATFVETQPSEVMEFKTPEISMNIADKQPNLQLDTFFQRPTLIDTITWGSGGVSSGSFKPWTQFLSNTYISKKLENYALFRGNLHLKLIITANPFVYGAALLSYTPIQDNMTDSIAETTGSLQNSQKPHIWVWPQNNAGGELVLPFFYKSNFVNILESANTDALGECRLEQVIALDTANDTAIPTLSIQIYAWCTEVALQCPTTQAILQVGTESEYRQGPVERVASAIAGAATALTTIPMIQPFALATSMAATATAGIASLFGWSKAVLIEGARPIFRAPFHGLASSEISNAVEKVAFDQKTELSVDPRILNLSGQDELALSYLLQKEAYVYNSNWLSSDSIGDQLFEFPVWPMIYRVTDMTDYDKLQMTPMAYFAAMFRYWRGDIIFRFRLVASQYHRGRIKITYEPKGEVGASDYTNIAITKIVDITEENDIEFVVPYSQEFPWCRCNFSPSNTGEYGKTASITHTDQYTNGTIRVQVLTTLSSPQAAPSCHILAYARGAENLELSVPNSTYLLDKCVTHLDMQVGTESDIVTGQQYDERYKVNFGEQIVSLRTLLSRASLSSILTPLNVTTTKDMVISRLHMGRYPFPIGYDTNAYLYSEKLTAANENARFTFSYMHPINWVSACFAALRGGIQVKFQFTQQNEVVQEAQFIRMSSITRSANSSLETGYIANVDDYGDNQSMTREVWSINRYTGRNGIVLTNMNECECISAEMPDQHQYLFNSTRQEDWLLGTSWDDTDYYTYWLQFYATDGSGLNKSFRVSKYMNIAPDFNLHFFVCTPTVYYSHDLGQPKYVA